MDSVLKEDSKALGVKDEQMGSAILKELGISHLTIENEQVAYWSKANRNCARSGLVFEESVPDVLARIAEMGSGELAGKAVAENIIRHSTWKDAVKAVEQSMRDNMLGWHHVL